MSNEHSQSDRPPSPRVEANFPVILDYVSFPDVLLDWALCQNNKEFITDPEINDYVDNHLLPQLRQWVTVEEGWEIHACANHVHIGDQGIGLHDHQPHTLTSVLFLTQSRGILSLCKDDGAPGMPVKPQPGRFVIMRGTQLHQVFPSPLSELRVTLVTNYECRRTQAVPTALPDVGYRAHRRLLLDGIRRK